MAEQFKQHKFLSKTGLRSDIILLRFEAKTTIGQGISVGIAIRYNRNSLQTQITASSSFLTYSSRSSSSGGEKSLSASGLAEEELHELENESSTSQNVRIRNQSPRGQLRGIEGRLSGQQQQQIAATQFETIFIRCIRTDVL